jgi:hypothetical protein
VAYPSREHGLVLDLLPDKTVRLTCREHEPAETGTGPSLR